MSRAVAGLVRGSWLALALVVAWYLLSRDSESFFFPPLSQILERFVRLWTADDVLLDVWESVRNLLSALLLSVVVGIPLGVLLGRWRRGYDVLAPFLSFVWALPKLALLPAFIALIGLGSSMQITYVFMGTVWPIMVGTIDGIRAADPTLKDTMRTYRIRTGDLVMRVLLPGAAPQILAGVRTALSYGLVLVIVGEMLASSVGIGFFVRNAQQSYGMLDMWAGALIIGLLGFTLNLLFSLLERRFLAWHIARRALHTT